MNTSHPSYRGHRFPAEIISHCVWLYFRFTPSFRDVEEMMAERGVRFAHTTVRRWVQRFIPVFEKRWMRFARPVGKSWRVDETYIRVRGQGRFSTSACSNWIPILGSFFGAICSIKARRCS